MSKGKREKAISVMALREFDELTEREARKIFAGYRNQRVISDCVFDDMRWNLTDEYANYHFDFSMDNVDINEEYLLLYKCTRNYFETMLKAYILMKMGELTLGTLQHVILHVKYVLSLPIDKLFVLEEKLLFSYANQVAEFFSLLPTDNETDRDTLLEIINQINDDQLGVQNTNARELASFDSYFKLDDILNRYYEEETDERLLLFYFPVYFWWKFSAIKPMRPREYVLTPRNCLEKVSKNGTDLYYITVREDKLKGSKTKKAYTIKEDYNLHTVPISKKLAKRLEWYLNATAGFDTSELDTLFSLDIHYANWDRSKSYRNRYYTYANLSTCLKYFYKDVVEEKYGYEVIYDRQANYLKDKQIHFVYLGDTRHIALINMIMEGKSPEVAAMLAGHDDINMTAHYFSNVTKMVECKVYRHYQKQVKGKQHYTLSGHYSNGFSAGKYTEINGGRCYSPQFGEGDISDCQKVSGPAGEIGFCESCHFFRSSAGSFHNTRDYYKNEIEIECEVLSNVISDVRKGKKQPPDIIQEIMKLQEKTYSYQQYLEEIENGKEQEDID